MGIEIDNLPQLQALLKSSGLKVNSVEELQKLLLVVNASYDPDAARVKTGKLIALLVPIIMGGAGFLATSLLVPIVGDQARHGIPVKAVLLGGLGIIWGAVALVSIVALGVGLGLLMHRQQRPAGRADTSLREGLPSGALELPPGPDRWAGDYHVTDRTG
jgi:hypothetical protein